MARDLGAKVVIADRPQCLRRADPVCAAGEHLARGLWPVGAFALGHSAARLGAEPVSFRGARRHRAGGADAEAAAEGIGSEASKSSRLRIKDRSSWLSLLSPLGTKTHTPIRIS